MPLLNQWRRDPPESNALRYDLDAHYARTYSIPWVGYTGHLTETCDNETPPLITHVLTTTAPIDDSKATTSIDNRDNAVIKIKFARGDGCGCPYRSPCTRTARRSLTVRPHELHEALMANRTRPPTPEFKTQQARRCGIEGSLSYGIRICGMRRARDIGLAKTHLQHCASAAVMNLVRTVRWLSDPLGVPIAPNPVSEAAPGGC